MCSWAWASVDLIFGGYLGCFGPLAAGVVLGIPEQAVGRYDLGGLSAGLLDCAWEWARASSWSVGLVRWGASTLRPGTRGGSVA